MLPTTKEMLNLILYVNSSNPDIQKNAIALINALFLKADPEKRKVCLEIRDV